MSLLLDALKRAEQEKLARQGQEAAPAETGSADAAAGLTRDRTRLELESLEESPADAAVAAPLRRDRESARTVFAAKQATSASGPAAVPGRNKAVLALGIGALVILGAGGAYVWYELDRTPATLARAPVPVSPRPVTPAAVPPPAAGGSASQAARAPGGERAASLAPPTALPAPVNPAAVPPKSKPEPKAAEQLVMSLLRDASTARPAPPLKLARTIETPRVSTQVSLGYEALKRGDDREARRHYEAAVAADATSPDAHLGLAAAAARTGDRATASRHYRRALDLDPQNASAIAGLAALADFSRPEALETQLRADITRHPQSPALHYTLGNLYAANARWNEAQAAYFEAFRLDPENADVAYNLAVSLDHLGQSKPAADFYQRALAASGSRNAQFDRDQVARRIAELRP